MKLVADMAHAEEGSDAVLVIVPARFDLRLRRQSCDVFFERRGVLASFSTVSDDDDDLLELHVQQHNQCDIIGSR